jgi:2',3'-cyclic-nucleotide 2'-phosphodiesterase (5'-nucleotidase family)
MERRTFLQGAALGALAGRLPAAGAKAVVVTILHTNDIHGHLTPWQGWDGDLKGKTVGGLGRLAGAIARERKAAGEQNVLLLDAGDLLGDTMLADRTEGKALVEALDFLKYDALTVGNHEPDFGTDALKTRIDEASFPTVACNLTERASGKLFTRPYVVQEVAGVKVGVLGLAYPKTARTTAPKNVAAVEFRPPGPAVREYLPKLRADGAELVVALSHLGLGADLRLVRDVAGIDVIVGGHSHNRMADATRVGNTLIVQAGAHGSDLGRLDLTVENGKVTGHKRTLIPLPHDAVPADPAAEKFLARLLDPHREALDEVVGKAAGWLVRADTLAGQGVRKRAAESPVDSLFADILRAATGADVCLLPGVGYGVAIPPGPVTAAQLRQLAPHDGKVVTMKLPGRKILAVLEQAVENTFTDDPAVKVGGMIQVSGLRFTYDPDRPRGERVRRVELTDAKWNPAAEYTVATNGMLAAGGHNYAALKDGTDRKAHSGQYETIRDWFGRHSPISTPEPGRIARAKKGDN